MSDGRAPRKVAAAPVEPERRKVPVEVLVSGYLAGRGIRALVTETGVPYGTIHTRLREAGVQLRPRGVASPETQQRRAEDRERRAANGGR